MIKLFLQNKHSIAYKLLKIVFTIYFSLTFIITLSHMAIEYKATKSRIQHELFSLEKSFKEAITTAMWELNNEQLYAIAKGVSKLPVVKGIDIVNAKDELQMSLGKTLVASNKSDLFFHQFEIHREFNNKVVFLGWVRFYSDSSVIIDQIKLGFFLIALNALIKSVLLTVLFLWAFRKYLFTPLNSLTQQVEKVNLDNVFDVHIDTVDENNELKLLENGFNHMLKHIEHDRNKLDERHKIQMAELNQLVIKRTVKLDDAINELNKIAFSDPLTQIKNRRSFFEAGHTILSVAKRERKAISLLMMDIDFFKKINDSYGHHIGDEVLIDFTRKIACQLRESDLFARIGGEEFAIILSNTDSAGAQQLAEKICKIISLSTFNSGEVSLSYTVSIGVAQWRDEDTKISALLNRADQALYQAKNNGRNKVQTA